MYYHVEPHRHRIPGHNTPQYNTAATNFKLRPLRNQTIPIPKTIRKTWKTCKIFLRELFPIPWSFDPDTSVLPPPTWNPAPDHSASSGSIKNAFDVLLANQCSPATIVAGHRHSTRPRRPSAKILEARNSENTKGKCKASPEPPTRAVSCKVSESASEYEMIDSDGTQSDHIATDVQSEDDDDDVEIISYEQMKTIGTSDVVMKVSKSNRTIDILVIFKKTSDTNVKQAGHSCGICKRKGFPSKHYFFTGSVTSLCKHIARNPDHFIVYKTECEKRNIEMHPTAIPASSGDFSRQSTLDMVVVKQPTVEFSVAGLKDYIIALVVIEDTAMYLVSKPSFRQLLQFCRPSLKDKDLISPTELCREIIKRAGADVPSKVSFTFDLWTSDPSDPYLSATCHYIWAPKDQPTEWELKCENLAFAPFLGHHSGANQAAVLLETFKKYGIDCKKLGWLTADNASNNDTALTNISFEMNNYGAIDHNSDEFWDPTTHRIRLELIHFRCMEHVVHLASGAFIKGVSPASKTAVLDNSTDNEDNDGDSSDANDDLTAGDAVGKLLALINQIRKSPQAHAFFKECCIKTNNKPLELMLWIHTHWASLFAALERAIQLEKTADDDDKVPKLRNKAYCDYRLTRAEWDHLKVVHEALSLPAKATQSFSSARHPTLLKTIPTLEYLRSMWVSMAVEKRFESVKGALWQGIASIDKWYNKVDHSSAYFITFVLDPTVKLAYVSDKWDASWVMAGMASLESEFDHYYIPPEATETSAATVSNETVQSSGFGRGWMMASIQNRVRADAIFNSDPRAELRRYLESPLEPLINPDDQKELDIVRWWGCFLKRHQQAYPTLSRMARDYLAIQGSATPSERAFSSAGLTDQKRRNRLSPATFSALQTLKAAYRNGHISAYQQAAEHIKDFMETLDEYYFGGDESEDEDSNESDASASL
ncbi:hypothetical protein D9758_017850 [Tetrapyrgos nigripes]|uniref:HAT C-terminal dimerisation domain-containing protein n=1 Tax=Tetrapyrgos nigripes TaxID=182062 RepID=A0A8H5BAU7_9AGAR|nr:hypothetical protein D9758_017850 [Tetrapyrgos nigripes]